MGILALLSAFGRFDIWHLLRVFEKDISLLNNDSSLGYQERTHVNSEKSHFTFMLREVVLPQGSTEVNSCKRSISTFRCAALWTEQRHEAQQRSPEPISVLHAAQDYFYLSVSLTESERRGHSCDSLRPALEMQLLFRREIIIVRADRFACLCLSAECWLACLQTSLISLQPISPPPLVRFGCHLTRKGLNSAPAHWKPLSPFPVPCRPHSLRGQGLSLGSFQPLASRLLVGLVVSLLV